MIETMIVQEKKNKKNYFFYLFENIKKSIPYDI